MKKKLLVSFFFIAFFNILIVNAAKIRVNNTGGIDADYTNLQTAINAASQGDTIYVEPSSVSYGDATIAKKLTIIGPGFFLTENPETQVNPGVVRLANLNLNDGSDSSFITGLTIESQLTFYPYNNGDINNVIITRNHINRLIFDYYTTGIGGNNNMILQNYFHYSGGISYTIDIEDYFDNTIIQNNYISSTYSTPNAFIIDQYSTASLSNNVIRGNVNNRPSTLFENNIFIDGTISDITSLSSFSYNMATTSALPSGNNNVNGVILTDILNETCPTCGSTDGQYQIDSTGAAFGHATDGTQCGMFGGANPYVLSGLPAVPAIYYLSAPSSASQASGLPVTIKIKSHK